MCGFTGFIDHSAPGLNDSVGLLETMVDTIVHRGPDDHGIWSDASGRVHLGFRRLAIQDLSPLGHQPMRSPSGRWVAVFNGEVYNFKILREELRSDGVSFRGGSDTEVLLAGVERWGPEAAIRRLRGMFGLALWDEERSELRLVRDRLGIKPLYLATTPDGYVFGSELRTLLPHPFVKRRASTTAAWHFLRKLYVPAPRSILEGVEKVAPGSIVRLRRDTDGRWTREDELFWELDRVAGVARRDDLDPDSVVDELHERLGEAVELRLAADVPVGALLSGGVDSSLVVALMAERASGPVRTFTIRFDDPRFDEGPVAEAVANHLGAEHTEVSLPADSVADLVPELPSFSDEPMANPSILPTLLVSQVARRDVTVALSGDGGDELFGGYNRYARAPGLLKASRWIPAAVSGAVASGLRGAADLSAVDALNRFLGPAGFGEQHRLGERLARAAGAMGVAGGGSVGAFYDRLMAVGWAEPHLRAGRPVPDPEIASAFDGDAHSLLARMMLADQGEYLPDDLLAKVDRASMWTALEVRVPILDHEVVEWSWTLPDAFKVRDGQAKWPLRALARRFMPAEILERPKMGFTVPLEQWLHGPLAEWLAEAVDPGRIEARGLLDPEAVDRLHRDFKAGRPGRALALWSIAVLEHWCTHYGVEFESQGS